MILLDKTMKDMYQMSSKLKAQRSLLNVYNYHDFGLVLYNFDTIDQSNKKKIKTVNIQYKFVIIKK